MFPYYNMITNTTDYGTYKDVEEMYKRYEEIKKKKILSENNISHDDTVDIDNNINQKKFKIKDYKILKSSRFGSKYLRSEFEKLQKENVTHIINMPGNKKYIYQYCKDYKIICIDINLIKKLNI